MEIKCEELQNEIKESLLHGLFNFVCDIAARNKIIVIPGLINLVEKELPDKITIKRLYTEYTIYTDFPMELLGLEKDSTLNLRSSLCFKWKKGEYSDAKGEGLMSIYLINKPKKNKK